MARLKPTPLCRTCNRPSPHGALFCTSACEDAHVQKRVDVVAQLTDEGFERDSTFHNLFVKDGIAVSLEKIEHVGMDQAILEHGHAVEFHRGK